MAIAETDRFGNLVHTRLMDLHTRGENTDQAKALSGNVDVVIVDLAEAAGKPIVVEALNWWAPSCQLW